MDNSRGSLSRRVFFGLLLVALLSLGLILGVSSVNQIQLKTTLNESMEESKDTTVEMSSEATREQAVDNLRASAVASADLCDDLFVQFKRSVETLAIAAEELYAHESDYGLVDVARPDASNTGELTVQLLYSSKVDEDSEEIIKETGLLGNMQGTLLAVHKGFEPIVADCVATESGIMMMADLISDTKFDENGDYLPYEADTRPWYIGVKETGETYFTKLSRDAHTEKIGIMCGSPIKKDGRIVAVCEAGMYLDKLEEAVIKAATGQLNGTKICIIDQFGQLVVSTAEDGIFAVDFENVVDLRETTSEEMAEFLRDAVSGGSRVCDLEVDGEKCYVVSAPLETVGWTYIMTVPENVVLKSTRELSKQLEEVNDRAGEAAADIVRKSFILTMVAAVLVIILAVLISKIVSAKLVDPIKKLTKEVKKIEGDNLDFSLNLNTGDEIQTLAESFGAMTQRMRKYIDEVKTVTAEKERIGAELGVATRIQADMLPRIFPPYPEREDVDLYAMMDPAKEVGGDFYDFFLLDDDHLVLVMADVSGKGVPAALFMVIAKTLIIQQIQNLEISMYSVLIQTENALM